MVNPFTSAWNAFWGAENEPNQVRRMKPAFLAILLRRYQVGIRAIVAMQMICLVLWSVGSVVPGFGFYDGAAGKFNAISHLGFWLGLEIFILFVGMAALSFEMNNTVYESDDPRAIQQVNLTGTWLIFWIVMLVLGILANITHIVACAFELSDCSSSLCMNFPGFLIAFIVLLSIVLLIEVSGLYYACMFKRATRWLALFLEQRRVKK